MSRSRGKPSAALIDQMLGEASWLLSHAQALGDYGRYEEAAAEQARAATCEEQVACLLDAAGQEREAAIHRISAATCYEKLRQYPRAATLLRAALATDLPNPYRDRVRQQLTQCLDSAQKELKQAAKRGPHKRTPAIS